MGDKTRGVHHKYDIRRTDGSDEPGGKHDGCAYFVLDLDHDPHAKPALLAYADSCAAEYPLLAQDLRSAAESEGASSPMRELIRAAGATPEEKNLATAGWAQPVNARKEHYFPANASMSLCGNWGFFLGARVASPPADVDACRACRAVATGRESGE